MKAKEKILCSALTQFQKLVLIETLKIPRGKTITYGELARRIGRPKAARAVGNALNINPFAPGVPCHRVVGKGNIGGYAGGTEKKKAILRSENAIFEWRKV
jgi:methylated-DNA-[protein]-cysteine S-methyltransferase